jgi:hypothetical protein
VCLRASLGGEGVVGKISPPPGIDLRTVQPVSVRLTDYAILNHNEDYTSIKSDCSSIIKL